MQTHTTQKQQQQQQIKKHPKQNKKNTHTHRLPYDTLSTVSLKTFRPQPPTLTVPCGGPPTGEECVRSNQPTNQPTNQNTMHVTTHLAGNVHVPLRGVTVGPRAMAGRAERKSCRKTPLLGSLFSLKGEGSRGGGGGCTYKFQQSEQKNENGLSKYRNVIIHEM